jgi:hypothetical protein
MEKVKVQIVWNKNDGTALDLLPGCVAVVKTEMKYPLRLK